MYFYDECINIYKGFILLLNLSLHHDVVSSFVFYYSLSLNVCYLWYKYCYPSFFSFLLAWANFFHPFTFSLCVSFILRWVLVDSLYRGLVFLSIQLPYVFWLECIIPLYLMWLLIVKELLPFYFSYLCSFFTLFLKEDPLIYIVMLVWW